MRCKCVDLTIYLIQRGAMISNAMYFDDVVGCLRTKGYNGRNDLEVIKRWANSLGQQRDVRTRFRRRTRNPRMTTQRDDDVSSVVAVIEGEPGRRQRGRGRTRKLRSKQAN